METAHQHTDFTERLVEGGRIESAHGEGVRQEVKTGETFLSGNFRANILRGGLYGNVM